MSVDFNKEYRDVDTYNAKCPACGGTMAFNPQTQSLKCEHCGTEERIDKNYGVEERDISLGL